MRRASLRMPAMVVVTAVAACGGGEPSTPGTPTPTTPATPIVATVSVSASTPSIAARQTTTLAAQARDASGALVSGTVSWSSSDTLIAVVSPSGVVAGISAGTATITATQGGKSGSATVTVQPGAMPIRGVWAQFEHLGVQGGYWNGEIIKTFDQFDPSVGGTVGQEVAKQMDLMRSFGINAISLQIVGADSVAGDVRPPVCSVNPVGGTLWPQPTATELANLVKFFDLAQQKGIRVLLELSHTHFEESPPTNATTWLTAMINAIKNHPALELVTFMGDVHVNNFGTPTCGLPSEPALWLGPSGVVYSHLKFEMSLARSLGLAPRKISAEAILGDYATQVQTDLPGTNHGFAPIVTLKRLFDDLSWPDSLRTYALSFYFRRKCEPGSAPSGCVDASPADWTDQEMRYAMSVIGAGNGARVVAVEYGVYPDGASTPEQSVTGITSAFRKYGADGGAYWIWVETDNAYEASLPFAEAIVKRGTSLQFNPVKDALVKAYLP